MGMVPMIDRDNISLMRGMAVSCACFAVAVLLAAASARAQTASYATQTNGPTSAGQNSYTGSVPSAPVPGVLPLSLQDAIDRGLKQNLGLLLSGEDVRTARGARWQQLSALLPNLTASPYVDASQVSLAEFGFSFKFPGLAIPSVVGPFAYVDARVNATQSLFDWKAINNSRSAAAAVQSSQYSFKDAHDLVVLAVGYSYLLAVADEARIETTSAQVDTAQALYNQASDQVNAGTSPAIDGLRARVELQTRQQRLIQARNDFAIQKLALARVIGLAPGQQFDLTDKSPYKPFAGFTVDEALERARQSRSDYRAAEADVRAADYSKRAAQGEYLPSLSLSADYGLATTLSTYAAHGVFDVRGTLSIPIFLGGRVHGDVLQADAALAQSRQRLDSLRAQIDTDVRTALLNLESAEEQVVVARSNVDLADQTLDQARDRFAAGVTDTVEVVQAQETVASAHEQYISSLYSDNYAKISLARAMGQTGNVFQEYFQGK
jgi:outer membrane protein TolC